MEGGKKRALFIFSSRKREKNNFLQLFSDFFLANIFFFSLSKTKRNKKEKNWKERFPRPLRERHTRGKNEEHETYVHTNFSRNTQMTQFKMSHYYNIIKRGEDEQVA